MKTAIKKSLVLVALLVAVSVSYGNEVSGNPNNGKNVRTNVTFKDVKRGSVLSIMDMNGLVLYKEAIKKSGNYTKGFDLTSLPNGDYYFELNKEVEIKFVPFKVVASVVTFDKAAELNIFKPVVYVRDKNISITKLALGSETLSIEIFSESGDSVYSEKIEKVGNLLGRIFDFSTSEKGNYTIVIKTKERRFVENIQI